MAPLSSMAVRAEARIFRSRASKGKPSAVLMSLEDFASYEETRYLLRSPANAERLLASVAELDRGDGHERPLAE